jgi:hypothetical protein
VVDLGLQTTLGEYKVPREDIESIAEAALGTQNQQYEVKRIVQTLEEMYAPLRL